jgi:hypothetical protein
MVYVHDNILREFYSSWLQIGEDSWNIKTVKLPQVVDGSSVLGKFLEDKMN